MALPASPPARVFAQLGPTAPAPAPALERGGGCGGPPPPREVHVSGSAELSAGPDRARVCVRLGSRKAAAAAARGSVARRLEYIAQSARRRGVPEENMTITEDFSRLENTYQMEAEVCIIFSDFGKMQNVCNLLIEKLGTSVTISPPHFYHSPEAVDTLRSLHRITTGSLPKEEASHDRTRSRSSQSINTEFEMMMIRLCIKSEVFASSEFQVPPSIWGDLRVSGRSQTLSWTCLSSTSLTEEIQFIMLRPFPRPTAQQD
ncbi:interleukin-1 receptor-associated kinase 1-binding protein 1 isoform X4 [Struthio camelus]|uniref:interleukin-1 receptor-associated kinase 1-binding protein 1 isoform X4 n=1 Tax=Struthio camelus TaxID=8801 RepID=UPI0036042357